MKRDPNCTLCPLHKTAKYVCLLGQGPEPSDVMIVGEAPGKREDNDGKPFVGSSGQLLDDMLEEVGLSREDAYITNAVNCRPPDNRTPKKKEIAACRKWMDYQIAKVDPKYILTLGNVPLQSILGVTGIKKMRGKPIEKDGRVILPTYHPSFALRDDRNLPVLQKDVQAFKDIIEFGGIPEERDLKYQIVDTWNKFYSMVDDLIGTVSHDIETTGLYPWHPDAEVVSLGFGTHNNNYILPAGHKESMWSHKDIQKMWEDIEPALTECEVVTHAGKFDALWDLVHYGVKVRLDFDTMLAHYNLDENSLHDLEHLASLYYGAPAYDIPLEEKQGKGPLERHAKYLGKDLFYTRKLRFTLAKELDKEPTTKKIFEKITMPAANLYVNVENRGVYIDLDKMDIAEKFLKTEKAKAQKEVEKHGGGGVNLGSPQQIGEWLFGRLKIKPLDKTAGGKNSTSESVMKRIDHPAAGAIIRYRGHSQQLSFFIEGWKPYIVNRRLHPSFKLHGTVTSRFSCEHPNLQQVPRDVRIRSLITAPPGWDFVEADLSQIELRIAAELADEPNMKRAFKEGVDIHWLTCLTELERGAGEGKLIKETAIAIAKKRQENYIDFDYGEAIEYLLKVGPEVAAEINPVWKEFRKKAKAVNFGYLYSMWWKKFKIYARDNYDLSLTDEQCQESRVAFFDMFPELTPWHKKQKWHARAHGYVMSLSGRKRRLPAAMKKDDSPEAREAERQAINSPVQSFAHELNLMIALQVREEFPEDVLHIVGEAHDANFFEVRKDYTDRVCRRLLEIMRHPKMLDEFDIEMDVPLEGEVKVGPWGLGKVFHA